MKAGTFDIHLGENIFYVGQSQINRILSLLGCKERR